MISVVVPVYNEEGTVEELHRRLLAVLRKQKEPFEIIFVNDCSTDATFERLKSLRPITVLSFSRNCGDTVALDAGIEAARGETIVFLDADLQDAPEDVSLLLAKLEEGYEAVLGWRVTRKDRFARILFSRVANVVVSLVLWMRMHDAGCGLKAYRASCIKGFNLWGKVQVFLPAIAKARGARICEVAVSHKARSSGDPKIPVMTMLKGGLGLLEIAWYRYVRAPYRRAPVEYEIRERIENTMV